MTLKIVELPGHYLDSLSPAYTQGVDHAKKLIRYYLRYRKAAVSVLERANGKQTEFVLQRSTRCSAHGTRFPGKYEGLTLPEVRNWGCSP